MMSPTTFVHPTAIIEGNVNIGDGCYIGPYVHISGTISIGNNSVIMSHAIINGHVTIGINAKIFSFACIGYPAQDKKDLDVKGKVIIGNNIVAREYCTISGGKLNDDRTTHIGDNCYFMISSHVGHDCIIGNNVTLTNQASISGHCIIDDFVNIGGMSGIHQFVHIGTMCMIGGGAMISKNVPPFSLFHDHYLKMGNIFKSGIVGLNLVGLRRKKYSNIDLQNLKEIFEFLFWENEENRNVKLENLLKSPKLDKFRDKEYFKTIERFILQSDSKRGIYRNLIAR